MAGIDREKLPRNERPVRDDYLDKVTVAVMSEFGLELGEETEVRVVDSNSELRFLVIPRRPEGTDGWSEERLAALVNRNSMIGVAAATEPDTV